jgi:hypothetical protein
MFWFWVVEFSKSKNHGVWVYEKKIGFKESPVLGISKQRTTKFHEKIKKDLTILR